MQAWRSVLDDTVPSPMLSDRVFRETCGLLQEAVRHILQEAVRCTTAGHRNIVSAVDMVRALKRRGSALYGITPSHHSTTSEASSHATDDSAAA